MSDDSQCVQGFVFEYAEHGDIPLELFWRGMISLTLTAVNILCIIIVGVLMLLVKQVRQHKMHNDHQAITDSAANLTRNHTHKAASIVVRQGKLKYIICV